jgi:hypothetical protein
MSESTNKVILLFIFGSLVLLNACRSTKEISDSELEAMRRDSLASVQGKAFFIKGIEASNEKAYSEALMQFKSAEPFVFTGTKFNANDKACFTTRLANAFSF